MEDPPKAGRKRRYMPKKKDDFIVPLEELLEAGAHFGHQTKRWNPKMKSYIHSSRGGVHIFDLVKTARGLQNAYDYVYDLVKKGGRIVFVGTKRQAQSIIREEAKKCETFHVTERWLGGTITNWDQIGKRVERLQDLKSKKESGEFKKYTKKENVLIDREINKLERFVGGLEGLKKIPDAIFVVDVNRESAAVKEARMRGVKIVAIVDSNADQELVDYVIPANDDAIRSIKLIVEKIGQAVLEGKKVDKKQGKK